MKKLKKPTVFLVVDQNNAPGRVMAIFVNAKEAEKFCNDECSIEERTLWYGQPDNRDFNL